RGFLDVGGLLTGRLAQGLGGRADLLGGTGEVIGRITDLADDLGQSFHQGLHGALELAGFVGTVGFNADTEITLGQTLGDCDRFGNGTGDTAGYGEGNPET